jgi:predicted TIM-barrel fold metal-dependent hydrolase
MNAPHPHPVVDAHHHLWRRADLAWLDGPPVPRIFGAYEPIRRDYLAAEFLADCTPAGVTRSVYVQTNWPAAGELEEVRWVQSIAEQSGFPHAIVAGANLADPGVADRCMSGSNFPVEKLWTDYRSLFDVFRQCVDDRPLAEQRAILHDTACRIYRLLPDLTHA